MALDSAKTLSPVPRLLNLTLALFYACSTFDLIKLKGPTIFVILLIALTSWLSLLAFVLLLAIRFVVQPLLEILRGDVFDLLDSTILV